MVSGRENRSLKDILLSGGGIKFGHFVLTSGKESDYYVDIKEVMTDPANLERFAESISEHVSGGIIAGVELGAVPVLVAVSLHSRLPYVIIRKEREHGTKSLMIGKFERGSRVDIIEDVVTTGGSVLKAVNLLREQGADVSRCICVVDREQGGEKNLSEIGVELIALIKISDVLKDRKS